MSRTGCNPCASASQSPNCFAGQAEYDTIGPGEWETVSAAIGRIGQGKWSAAANTRGRTSASPSEACRRYKAGCEGAVRTACTRASKEGTGGERAERQAKYTCGEAKERNTKA